MLSPVTPNKAIIGLGCILKLNAEFKISNIENQNCLSLVHDQNMCVRSTLDALQRSHVSSIFGYSLASLYSVVNTVENFHLNQIESCTR